MLLRIYCGRSRKPTENDDLVAKIGVDKAENEHRKGSKNICFVCCLRKLMRIPRHLTRRSDQTIKMKTSKLKLNKHILRKTIGKWQTTITTYEQLHVPPFLIVSSDEHCQKPRKLAFLIGGGHVKPKENGPQPMSNQGNLRKPLKNRGSSEIEGFLTLLR